MEYRNKLVFFVFILLAILGIYTYFYISKSQIEKDFEIAYKPHIYADLIYEEVYENGTGRYLISAIPYFYKNTPYIIIVDYDLNESFIYNYPPPPMVNYTVKLYNPINREIVDEANVTVYVRNLYFFEVDLASPIVTAYTFEDKKIISIFPTFVWNYSQVFKIVIEDAKVKEIKKYEFGRWFGEENFWFPSEVWYAAVFEGNNTDYILVVRRDRIIIFDEQGNILFDKSDVPGRDRYVKFYETKNYVAFTIITDEIQEVIPYTYTFIYDKKNNNLSLLENFFVLFGNYEEDVLVLLAFNGYIYIFTKNIGLVGLPLIVHNVGGGIVTDDKIILLTSLFYDRNTPIYYWLYEYKIGEEVYISLMANGTFINLPNLLNESGYEYTTFYISELIPLNKSDNIYDIVYSKKDYVSFIVVIKRYATSRFYDDWYGIYGGWVGISGLIDLNNYILYPVTFYNNYEITKIEKLWEDNDEEYIRYLGANLYNTMYLSPVIYEAYYNSSTGDTVYIKGRVYMFYIDTSLLSLNNVTNETNRTRPQPQPGFGIVITAPEMNITIPPYNVTQNVTTTRRTGIQSVIEIIGRNWWLILLAILLLILIAASLRRRAS